jgi:hypothetical protein
MWIYNEQPFTPTEEELKTWVGFVYLITEKDTGMKYVGKKLFWSTRRLKPLKGKKRKRTVIKESDWQTYYGSSEELKLLIEENGGDNYQREILHFCTGKGEMSYMELKEQVIREVLLRDDYHNGIISCRINHRSVKQLKIED